MNLILEGLEESNLGKRIEACANKVLKDMSLSLKDAHLSSKRSDYRSNLESLLYKEKIDLSFKSMVLPTFKCKVGGNATGISSDVTYFLWMGSWEPVVMTKDEIINHLKKNKKAKCYSEDRFGNIHEIDKDKIINSNYGTTYNHQGYGSQSSVVHTSVELEKDKQGNLLLSTSVLTWD